MEKMKGSSRAVVLAWLVLAPLVLAQQAQAWAWGFPWPLDEPWIQEPDLERFPRHFRPVVDCVKNLSFHASEYYQFAEKGKVPSKTACRSLLDLPRFCQHRLQYFLNLPVNRTKKLQHVCHKTLNGRKRILSPSPSPSPSPA